MACSLEVRSPLLDREVVDPETILSGRSQYDQCARYDALMDVVRNCMTIEQIDAWVKEKRSQAMYRDESKVD